jgi:hypothetical protein
MKLAESHNAAQQFMLRYPRPVGVVLVLLGGLFCYWMIVQPIQQVEEGKHEIRISLAGAVISIVLVVFGLTYAIFGARFARLFQPAAEESKVPAYTVGALLALVGLGIYLVLKAYLESNGYVINR